MKRIVYSFLLIAVLSCGHSEPSSHNRISVQFRDSIRDYFLLSVRDSSLIVAPYQSKSVEMYQLLSDMQNIPLNKIEKIYDKGTGYPSSIVFPALGGAALAECATGTLRFSSGDGGGMSEAESKVQHQKQIYFPIGGAIAGGLFGYYAIYRNREVSIATANAMKNFRIWYAFYPDQEPVQLRMIK